MEHLKLFHRDVLTVRSHQWKYYVEPYSGCALQCTYCLYWETDAFVSRLNPPDDLLPGVERDLCAMTRKQIVYIGATVDPYQLLEKKVRATRQILERLVHHGIPVVILTKSPLILRDLDLLEQLNDAGLVLVQFTVLTTDEAKARAIERAAPSVADRLSAAAALTAAGIPVHFHLSPVIQGMYEEGELEATIGAIARNGGRCIYSNILGMRHRNTAVWFDSMGKLPAAVGDRVLSEYIRRGDVSMNVYSPDAAGIYEEMSRVQQVCRDCGVDFICEFIPGLDSFDPARFQEGIFRYGLPAVYQMSPLVASAPGHTDWATFSAALRQKFEAIDDEYLDLVHQLWESGELFENTTITAAEASNGPRSYVRTDRLHLAREAVLSWD